MRKLPTFKKIQSRSPCKHETTTQCCSWPTYARAPHLPGIAGLSKQEPRPNADPMLAHRQPSWPNIAPAQARSPVLPGGPTNAGTRRRQSEELPTRLLKQEWDIMPRWDHLHPSSCLLPADSCISRMCYEFRTLLLPGPPHYSQ